MKLQGQWEVSFYSSISKFHMVWWWFCPSL